MKFGCRGNTDKVGILIAQLGTPDAPTKPALRKYLKEFLADPRVIETNRILWWLILNGIILNTRPKRSAALYKRIWTPEGSPLLVITKKQTAALREKFQQSFKGEVEVEFGMRYGSNSLQSAIDKLVAKGCARIVLFPMYPQYSAATTASIYDVVFAHLLKLRNVPSLKVVAPYYNNSDYQLALATVTNEALAKLKFKPEKIVLSYHGIPQDYVKRGDVYCCMCNETTKTYVPNINFPKEDIIHTFQSRFGRQVWLQPYTDETIEGLAEKGIKKIAVSCPGFTTDCLETLDEIGNEASHAFKEAGGEQLSLIPCLNDNPVWIEAMGKIILAEAGNWLDASCQVADSYVKCPCGLDKVI